jgi:beta-mannan synthase
VVDSVLEQLLRAWSFLAVPLLTGAVTLCMIMSVMVLAEKVFLGTVSAAANLFRSRRRRRPGKGRSARRGVDPAVLLDEEAGGGGGSTAFPMVLVQIPMYNEREVRTQCYVFMKRISICICLSSRVIELARL